jgi:tRNA (mo5U34)-methyltransferase
MLRAKEELQAIAASVPFWWHSIDLGHGVVTKGFKSSKRLARELQALRLPDLKGKTVLDIGTFDGFFSFEAERRGAKRVVALDHFVWSLDIAKAMVDWRARAGPGVAAVDNGQASRTHPGELPGMLAYNTAHRALHSKAETVVADFMENDLNQLGTFDVVLYLGVLYHIQNPFEALKRVAAVTGELAIIETEALAVPNYEDHALCEFFEAGELNGDPTNWWAPNEKAIVGMCRAAGFRRVETIVGAPKTAPARLRSSAVSALRAMGSRKNESIPAQLRLSADFLLRELGLGNAPPPVVRYRAVVHAWK